MNLYTIEVHSNAWASGIALVAAESTEEATSVLQEYLRRDRTGNGRPWVGEKWEIDHVSGAIYEGTAQVLKVHEYIE